MLPGHGALPGDDGRRGAGSTTLAAGVGRDRSASSAGRHADAPAGGSRPRRRTRCLACARSTGARPGLAPHVVHRAHRRAARAACRRRRGGQRAGDAGDRRRAGALARVRTAPPARVDRGGGCRRRWPTCRGRGVRHAGARGARAHRLRRAGPRRGAGGGAPRPRRLRGSPASTPATLAAALLPSLQTPLGPLAGGLRLADVARRRPARRAGLRAAAGRRRPSRPATSGVAEIARCCAGTCPPTTRSRRTPTTSTSRCWPTGGCAASSPAASTRCCGSATAAATPRLPRRRLQDQLARRRCDEPLTAWHYRPTAMADAMRRRPLPAAGAAVLGRAAPLPALAAARLRPGDAPRRRALPVPARHVRPRRRPVGRRRCRAGCSPGRRRPRWSPTCPTCWTGVRDDCTEQSAGRSFEPVLRAPGCSPTSTRPGAVGRRRARRDRGWAGSAARPTTRCCSPRPSRSGRSAHGSVCLDLATARADDRRGGRRRPRTRRRCRGRSPTRGRPPWRRARSSRSAPTATRRGRCGWSTGGSTSTATGGRSSDRRRVLDDAALPRRRPTVDAQRLRRGAGPALPRRRRRPAAAGRRGRRAPLGQRARRRPGHRQDHHGRQLLALLQDQAGGALRIALAAPTGKAAARLEEAVPARRPSMRRRRTATGSAR